MYILDLRIEWAWAQSRALRWDEERQLLPEEMRRTVTTHVGMHNQWLRRVNAHSDISADISRGLDAYAHRQANIYGLLATSFVTLWSPELRKNNISVDWPSELEEHAATVDAPPSESPVARKRKPLISPIVKARTTLWMVPYSEAVI
jgi:hypothetical protein